MKKIAALAWLPILLLASLCARALVITAQPGVSNQAVVQSAFVANVPAVRVTDDFGNPLAGVPVTFSVVGYDGTNGALFFPGVGFATSNDFMTVTDANGIATAGLGPFGFIPGPSGVTATATLTGPFPTQTASVTMPITVTAGGTTTFNALSGAHQSATVGTAYGSAWSVQALDANRQPVPNAAVLFYAPGEAGVASVTFDGVNSLWVRADANGIATSPVPIANLVEGKNEGFASTLSYGVSVTNAFFAFSNTKPAGGGGAGGGGGPGDGCGRQGKGNGNCGRSDDHSRTDNGKGNG
jgi:hypothetical protein